MFSGAPGKKGGKARGNKKLERLNLVPILDAVFIFIFFLLTSAQFIDIYELESDYPATAVFKQEKNKKEPLNLTIDIDAHFITIKTGLKEQVWKKIENGESEKFNFDKLHQELIALKLKNREETSVVLRPAKTIHYSNIVKIIDTVSHFEETKNAEGRAKDVLFNQIIFETLM
jgi:biopolymer transport protein ExbD